MADNTLLKETLESLTKSCAKWNRGQVCMCVCVGGGGSGILMGMAVPQRQMAQLCMKTHTGQTQVPESGTIPNQLICYWADCPCTPTPPPLPQKECCVFVYARERGRNGYWKKLECLNEMPKRLWYRAGETHNCCAVQSGSVLQSASITLKELWNNNCIRGNVNNQTANYRAELTWLACCINLESVAPGCHVYTEDILSQ